MKDIVGNQFHIIRILLLWNRLEKVHIRESPKEWLEIPRLTKIQNILIAIRNTKKQASRYGMLVLDGGCSAISPF